MSRRERRREKIAKRKKISMQCPNCKLKYPLFTVSKILNAKTGQLYDKLNRMKYCKRCGTGLVRRVEQT